MKAASDIKKGQKILAKGTHLNSRQIGMLAAIGKAKTKVYRTPRVAVLSTGPEITEPGKKTGPGKNLRHQRLQPKRRRNRKRSRPRLPRRHPRRPKRTPKGSKKRLSLRRHGDNVRWSLGRPQRHHAPRSQFPRKTRPNSMWNINQTRKTHHRRFDLWKTCFFASRSSRVRTPRLRPACSTPDPADGPKRSCQTS